LRRWKNWWSASTTGHAGGGDDRSRQHFWAVHFVNAAHKVGVKPIVGCELYICKKDDHVITRTPPDGDTYNHLLVLRKTKKAIAIW